MGKWFQRKTTSGDDGDAGASAAGQPLSLLRPSPRELVDDWLRTLTILGETDKTPQQLCDLIREVNQPGEVTVRIRTPLPPDDAANVARALEWYRDVRSACAGHHDVRHDA